MDDAKAPESHKGCIEQGVITYQFCFDLLNKSGRYHRIGCTLQVNMSVGTHNQVDAHNEIRGGTNVYSGTMGASSSCTGNGLSIACTRSFE